MKARVIATGEIVKFHHNSLIIDEDKRHYDIDELENIDAHDYWEKLLHQYAGMAMQGMIRTVGHDRMYPPESIAIYAVACATALVEKLKEKEKRK